MNQGYFVDKTASFCPRQITYHVVSYHSVCRESAGRECRWPLTTETARQTELVLTTSLQRMLIPRRSQSNLSLTQIRTHASILQCNDKFPATNERWRRQPLVTLLISLARCSVSTKHCIVSEKRHFFVLSETTFFVKVYLNFMQR